MKKEEKIAEAISNTKQAMLISLVVGGLALLLLVATTIGDIKLSKSELESAEVWHRVTNGATDSYPPKGVEYKLEARVVNNAENTEDVATVPADEWYHDIIAAKYGDTIEIRLKVTAAIPAELDREKIRNRTFFTHSSGLELLEAGSDHAKVPLPDGSLDDYSEDGFDDRVIYFAVGTFKFTSKDWWRGKSASAIVPVNPNMTTKIEVIAPYCDVYVPLVVVLAIACVCFLIIFPISSVRDIRYIRKHPEEFDDPEDSREPENLEKSTESNQPDQPEQPEPSRLENLEIFEQPSKQPKAT